MVLPKTHNEKRPAFFDREEGYHGLNQVSILLAIVIRRALRTKTMVPLDVEVSLQVKFGKKSSWSAGAIVLFSILNSFYCSRVSDGHTD